jgi:hypothetical protein
MRMGFSTVSTTAPWTWSPAEYLRCGSAGRMWKSVRLRARERSGRAKREKNERLEGESSNDAELAELSFEKVPIYARYSAAITQICSRPQRASRQQVPGR